MTGVLFTGGDARWREYETPLRNALAEGVTLATDLDAGAVEYIVYAPDSNVCDFTRFPHLKAVLSLWAGVEQIVGNQTLTVPLCRMVDPGLTEGMVEWVTGHVLRCHLGMGRFVQDGVWRNEAIPPLARDRSIGVLGLGALGSASAQALAALNFEVHGWSRRSKNLGGVQCHTDLDTVLRKASVLVLLLPQTPQTTDIINADRLALMPRGGHILNPGRGPLIVDADVLTALDTGQLASATLDVFRAEPLAPDHPFWHHPGITVTPHIASATRATTASQAIAENIRRGQAGLPFLHLVDRDAGY